MGKFQKNNIILVTFTLISLSLSTTFLPMGVIRNLGQAQVVQLLQSSIDQNIKFDLSSPTPTVTTQTPTVTTPVQTSSPISNFQSPVLPQISTLPGQSSTTSMSSGFNIFGNILNSNGVGSFIPKSIGGFGSTTPVTPVIPSVQPAPVTLQDQILELKKNKIAVDGFGNNQKNKNWNRAGTPDRRITKNSYLNGKNEPVKNRPNPRLISNIVGTVFGIDTIEEAQYSSLFFLWGQFIDHDITLSKLQVQITEAPVEQMNIPILQGDIFFNSSKDSNVMEFTRSQFVEEPSGRVPINSITGWLDGSMIYGSDAQTASDLRTFSKGELKTSEGNLLIKGDFGFIAGDLRVNENAALIVLQTLFAREHNRLCKQISKMSNNLSDQDIYNIARSINVGSLSKITYEDWLPKLLGPMIWQKYIGTYPGYNPNTDPRIPVEFNHAGFRIGHSLAPSVYPQMQQNGSVKESYSLRQIFGKFDMISNERIDLMLRGLVQHHAKKKTCAMIDDLRNSLNEFGDSFDLYTLNIQRGRDNGILDYNALRVQLGLQAIKSFNEVSSGKIWVDRLKKAYESINLLDPWVGIVCQDALPGAVLGSLGAEIVARTFKDLRNGDRFWYEKVMLPQAVKFIKKTTLSKIIKRNTKIVNIQEDAFLAL